MTTASIALLGLVVVLWSFVDAFANVARSRDPALTMRLRPNDPLALATSADRSFLADPANLVVRAASERDARRALDGALLNPTAVRLAAMQFERSPDRMLAALQAAQHLTRHDVTTQLQLIETNVAEGRVQGALLGYDHILRRKPLMGETLFPVLAAAGRDPNVAPVMAADFTKGLPWSGFFIDWAVANDQQLASLLPVLDAAPSNATGLSDGRKQNIVKRLVELGDYPAAVAAYRRYRKPAVDDATDFGRATVYAPFDWEIQNGPGVDGTIDPGSGLFHFALLGGGQGLLLRRLVAVAPGRYRLDVAGSINGPTVAGAVARVACATGGAALGSTVLRPGARASTADIAVPDDCRFAWLTLDGTTTPDEAAEGQLSRLRLTPVGAPRQITRREPS